MDFHMVIMASSIARGRERTMTATESHNMAVILPNNRLTETCSLALPCASLILLTAHQSHLVFF